MLQEIRVGGEVKKRDYRQECVDFFWNNSMESGSHFV